MSVVSAVEAASPPGCVRFVDAGVHTSVQGPPALHRAHLGFSRGGAADDRSLALANRAVGNAPDALALEATLMGPVFEVIADVTFAWCGAPGDVRVVDRSGDHALPPLTPRALHAGTRVTFTLRSSGARATVAFAGSILAVPARVLVTGDSLEIRSAPRGADPRVASATAGELDLGAPLRCTDSVQTALLPEAAARFFSEPFTVTPDASRRGVRLAALTPLPTNVDELASLGVALGAVQLPPSGQPIILGVDQTTTGGYPLIASVIRADAWRIGQLRPGATVEFVRVTHADARAAWLSRLAYVRDGRGAS